MYYIIQTGIYEWALTVDIDSVVQCFPEATNQVSSIENTNICGECNFIGNSFNKSSNKVLNVGIHMTDKENTFICSQVFIPASGKTLILTARPNF